MTAEKRPFDVFNAGLNKNVLVGIKGGKEFRGKLTSFDIHMNLTLEDAEELINGEAKRKIGTTLIRGDSVVYLSI